uniref:Calmodulin n=1 Tax=Amphora coffeiformis TaxID=265554 RepID=A0A7S3P310_9STRA
MKLLVFFTICVLETFSASLRGGSSAPLGRPSRSLINSRDYHERKLQDRELGIFDWELGLVDGFPQIGDFQDGKNSVLFLYNFTGDIDEAQRELEVELFQDDCLTPAPLGPRAPLSWNETLLIQELQVNVDVNVETIADSPFYTDIEGGQKALISFCLRVNYNYDGDGVNFHETIVSINVDLTAGFELTAVSVERVKGDNSEVTVNIGCEIYEYFCNDLYEDIGQPTFSQGDIMQACIVSTGDFNIRDIMEANLDQDKDRDGQWDTHDDIVTNFSEDALTEKSCSLGRCNIKTQLRSKYFTERVPNNITISGVVVCGLGASPSIIFCGGGRKPSVAENSTFVTYPAIAALNDYDGSDAWEEIVVEYSTPGVGVQPPILDFLYKSAAVNYDFSSPNVVRLTGNSAEIESSMRTLQVRPGTSNGEDIRITVTGTAYATTSPDVRITSMDSCTIPVDPVVQGGLTVAVPTSIEFNEDTRYVLQGFDAVFVGNEDLDSSEVTVLELNEQSYPAGTKFYANNALMTVKVGGWLQVPSSELLDFEIRPPLHFSGSFTLEVRAAITDTTQSGVVVAASQTKLVPFTVLPVADGVNIPLVIGIEDLGPIQFGSKLSQGLTVKDRAQGTGNNPESETITKIVFDVPADTDQLRYIVTGSYVQDTSGTLNGTGTAVVSYNSDEREYTVTSTLLVGEDLALISQTDRELAELHIRQTLASFVIEIGPEHSDDNGSVRLFISTADVKDGIASEKIDSFTPLLVAAVADLPTVEVVNPAEKIVNEDGESIPLRITVGSSPDKDNSETLSVRITVPKEGGIPIGSIGGLTPQGVTLNSEGSGKYLVTSQADTPDDRESLLNSFLSSNGNLEFLPRPNWSGSLWGSNGIRVDVISTEKAVGAELAGDEYGGADGTSKTETATAYIGVTVRPIADQATVSVKGNAIGKEDIVNAVPISVTLGDTDGSETYIMHISNVFPEDVTLFGADGVELVSSGGIYELQPKDIEDFAILPPLHWSSAVQGDVIITTTTIVTDSTAGSSSQSTTDLVITVDIEGVADKPNSKAIIVRGEEDTPYDIGSFINTSNVLVDADTSEKLFMLIKGLPSGVVPSSSSGDVSYIGSGKWQIALNAIPNLVLPPRPNYSGEDPYPQMTLQAVSQEMDGDEAVSDPWPVAFDIFPAVDGFASWEMAIQVSEQENESGGMGVPLGAAKNYALKDSDGSEEVIECTFDLSNLISDAGIATRLKKLSGPSSGLKELVDFYLVGDFVFDSDTSTITVLPDKIETLILRADLFLDSNQDFSIPVSILVRDSATLNGKTEISEKIEQGLLNVDLLGTADLPTVSAGNASGSAGTLVKINLAGASSDTDVDLGRIQSEEIYYIVTQMPSSESMPFEYAFVDGDSNVVGHDHGVHWLLYPEHLNYLFMRVPSSRNGTLGFRLATVALENDGDLAYNTGLFEVVFSAVNGTGGEDPPLPPILQVGINSGLEDNKMTLVADAFSDPNDLTNPSVTVVISGLPDGAAVEGARLNPFNNHWVAAIEDVRNGNVLITPPKDFGGNMSITLEAISTTASGLSATSGAKSTTAFVDPVADGTDISCQPETSLEDEIISLKVTLEGKDVDGSEEVAGFVFIRLVNDNAEIVGAFSQVQVGDPDATIQGVGLVGYTRVGVSEMKNIPIVPTEHWHGSIQIEVVVPVIETLDDADGDHLIVSQIMHEIMVQAQADPATLTVPTEVVRGPEDSGIVLPNLSVTLVDTVAANGGEQMSVTLSGLVYGSILNHGSNNGDGSWLVPANKLSDLVLTPPEHYSGTMTLALNAYTIEMSNFDEAVASAGFVLEVTPVADPFLMVAKDISLGDSGKVAMDLSLRMLDKRGDTSGELPAELVELTIMNLPTGVRVLPSLGGSLFQSVRGPTFLGSESQANSLWLIAGPGTVVGTHIITVSGITIDGDDRLDTPVEDTFRLQVTPPTVPGKTLTGTAVEDVLVGDGGHDVLRGGLGNDILSGGEGTDELMGGIGSDILSGGDGSDIFSWSRADLDTGVDRITDFTVGLGGDILDLHALWDAPFNPQSDLVSDYIRLTDESSGTTMVAVVQGAGGEFVDLVLLEGVTGINVDSMVAAGNILL